MKLLFAGLGSIGQRHIRDTAVVLSQMGLSARFFALRSSNGPLPGDVSALLEKTFYDASEVPDDLDACYICNPTSLHCDTAKALVSKTAAMFIEKPIFERPRDLGFLCKDALYYVACPLRFSPVLRFAKEYLRDKKPLRISAECSSYLPDWRPNTDYRRTYSAKKEQGGGVRLDLIHEWDYLIWLFGEPSGVTGVSGKLSSLEIDSEDCCVYSGYIGERKVPLSLSLDYFGVEPVRRLDVLLENGRVCFDILKNEVRASLDGETMTRRFEPVDIRRAEAEYFLQLITKPETPNINTAEDALTALSAALS